ncbi:MAG: argininosuccinate lyase [Deltaproteobacteria bacterium]|nr:argininosuccinate lyase [Deltaproteobacteria bacterium]
MSRLWDRGEPLDSLVLRYTAGEDHLLDERLVAYDCDASSAHAAMLHASGFLSSADLAALQKALASLKDSHAKGDWQVTLEDEDCHTAIENRLVGIVGEPGRAIHLGRSRNDQVLAALRLYLKDALKQLADLANEFADELQGIAKRDGELALPGYTHMQRAMPTTVALWAQGFAAEIRDDAIGLKTARRRADKNPLGSAAGYGIPVLTLSREHTTKALDFSETHTPVTAVQLSRGKAEATALFEVALLAQDLGRLASDLCLYATSEFGFVKLDSSITTGSSMLPQKRNPDLFELVRGRTSEASAAIIEVLGITAKMPSGYHRDMQLIKKPLFRGLDAVYDSTRLMQHALKHVSFDSDRMQAALEPAIYTAAKAYELVRDQKIPFREAYQRVRGTKK